MSMANIIENGTCLKHSVFRASFWAVSSATALYTTKLLLITHTYHYPATIASRIFGILLFGYICGLFVECRSRATTPSLFSSLTLRAPEAALYSPKWTWLHVVPAAVGASISLPFLLKGIAQTESLAFFVMLSPMIFAIKWTITSLHDVLRRSSQNLRRVWLVVLIMLASLAIVYHERRLAKWGLIWTCLTSVSIGVSKALFDIGIAEVEEMFGSSSNRSCRHGFILMSLTFGFITSTSRAILYEQNLSWHEASNFTSLLSLVSILSFAGALITGSSPLGYYPILCTETDIAGAQSLSEPNVSRGFITSISVLMVVLTILSLQPQVPISWTQIFCYLLSSAAAIELRDGAISGASKQSYQYLGKSSSPWETKRVIRFGVMLAPFYLAMVIIFIKFMTVYEPSTSPNHTVVLDKAYAANSTFDIVVSMYHEDPQEVKKMIDTLRTTTLLRTLTPRVIIYTKNNDASLSKLKLATGADKVLRLENKGREGATYLSHMISQWDDLATQTLFIQAQPHDMNEILGQLNAYLVPETGMLSLGITGVVCSCDTCEDALSDWEDTWSLIPDLYQKVYNKQCDSSTQILLSYAGQFVVSARRLRGTSKKIYAELLEALTSEDGWAHDPSKLGHEEFADSVDRPNFGYTTERTWALLMQCATNARIPARCPSLMSGMWMQGQMEDCQCLDAS